MPDIRLPKERNLFFTKQVTQDSVSDMAKAIVEINEDDLHLTHLYAAYGLSYNPNPIKIYIDSYGGQVYQILGLINVIEKSQTTIHTIVTGCAMSCGFVLLICGHRRFGYKHATVMYHQISSWKEGRVEDIKQDLKETERLQSLIEKIITQKTNITQDKLRQVRSSKYDWFIDAKEAIDLSIIDKIL